MGRIDPAPPPPGRGLGAPAGWIVVGALTIALAALVAFEIGKRSHVDREAPAAVASAPLVTASPALTSAPAAASPESQAPTSAPAAPQEGRVERAAMEVTIPPRGTTEAATRAPDPTTPPAARALVPAVECPDQAAAILPKLEQPISDFKREAELAVLTPRISLAPGISKLDEIYQRTAAIGGWPEEGCDYRLREKVLLAEEFDIARLKAFLGQEGGTAALARKSEELWNDVEHLLKELRRLVAATKRN